MKTFDAFFALLLAGLPGAARADDAVTVNVRCLGNPLPAEKPPTVMHAFGGQSLPFLVAVDAPLGAHLDLRADLVQTSGGNLGLPLQKDVPISGELVFGTRTHVMAACAWPLLPVVQRTTRFRLAVRGVVRDDPTPVVPAAMEVYVYPPENPAEWRKTLAARLAQSGLTRLEVFGTGTQLRRFFKDRHVEFEDGGGEWAAELHPRTLYVGDEPPPTPARISPALPGARLVVFRPPLPTDPPPGVYQSVDTHGGNIVKVFLPDLLAGLPDDPRNQQTLAEIFRQALDTRAPAADSSPNLATTP